MYPIYGYGKMISDKGRMDAYSGALRAVVRPDSVVIDIGTGTGIFALLACRFGARKVYAIEPGDIIQLARQTAAANGFARRIEFIQAMSMRVVLPERADVIVFDVRGVLPLHRQSLLSILDARDRFLAQGGLLVPRKDTLWAALLCAPEAYGALVDPWESDGYGFDSQSIRHLVLNTLARPCLRRENLVSEPRCWATIDYRTLSVSNIRGQISWTIDSNVTVHGLAVWFDCETTEGIAFSNLPGSRPDNVYGDAFFPWLRPVDLSPGDRVSVQIRADLVGGDYVWCWNTDITTAADPSRKVASFRQSIFQGAVVSPENLRKRAQSFVPVLNEDGRIDQMILQQMADHVPLEKIAQTIAAQSPSRFPTWQDALNYVGDLSAKYSQ